MKRQQDSRPILVIQWKKFLIPFKELHFQIFNAAQPDTGGVQVDNSGLFIFEQVRRPGTS